ncbi:MAG TPA: hypothetical protein VF175_17460, partial [Lacipirellula sp.]
HDGEGWCAIRPPEGSFSLAPAHQLRILDSRTAEVTGSGVVARVGSRLGPQHNAVQVLLERGEAVQIVEQPNPGDRWVKIAPPAGEFRWIASRRLSRTPPVEGAAPSASGKEWQSSSNQDESIQIPAEATSGDAFAHLSTSSPLASPAVANDAYPAWHPETTTTPSESPAAAATDDQLQVVAGSPAAVVLAQHQEPAGGLPLRDSTESSQPRIRFPGSGSATTAANANGPVDPRVAEIQLRLSQVVVQPPAAWQLAALREETAALLANEQQANVRNQLRDLLERIATFESVQARYRTTPAATATLTTAAASAAQPLANPATAASGAPAAPPEGITGQTAEVLARVGADLGIDNSITPTPGVQPPPTPTTGSFAIGLDKPATEALYDAVGTLKPVVSRREQAPRYALVDDHGNVVTFVTASTDVNLQPYIGKRIGVRGNRGFMPEYRRAHVTATRVTPLEEKLVR